MTSSFIDKWNFSVSFVFNNYKEYEKYIENILIDLFENHEFVKTNLAGFAIKQDTDTNYSVFAVLKESIPEEFLEVVCENASDIVVSVFEENSISIKDTCVYVCPFENGQDFINGRLDYGTVAVIK